MSMWDDLSKPFEPDKVHWRVGSTTKDKSKGLALAYVDARDVMERLDEVCGPDGWSDSYKETAKGRLICTIRVKIGDAWVSKSDGAGNTDVEGDKGAISDAFKRAAVKWGVGRYLYDLDSPWVPIEAFGNSYRIAESAKPLLAKALAGKQQQKPDPKPEYVKDAESILKQAKTVKRDEWDAFYDGVQPRLNKIKEANEKTYEHVKATLDGIDASMKVAA